MGSFSLQIRFVACSWGKSSFRRRLSSRISSQKQDPSDSDKSTKAVVPSEDLPLPALPSLQPAKEAARPPEAESAGVLDLNLKPGVPVVVAAAGKDVQLNAEDLQKQPQTRGSERHDYAATADTIATDAAGGNVSGADAIDDLIATTSYSPPPGSTGMLSFSQGDQIRVVKREAGGWLAAVILRPLLCSSVTARRCSTKSSASRLSENRSAS